MSVERLGSVDPLAAYNRNQKLSRSSATNNADSVQVSDEARKKAELFKLDSLVRSSEGVRADKIEEAKRKLEDPNYINDALLNNVADKIMESFGV